MTSIFHFKLVEQQVINYWQYKYYILYCAYLIMLFWEFKRTFSDLEHSTRLTVGLSFLIYIQIPLMSESLVASINNLLGT